MLQTFQFKQASKVWELMARYVKQYSNMMHDHLKLSLPWSLADNADMICFEEVFNEVLGHQLSSDCAP